MNFINKRRSFMAAICQLYLKISGFKKIYKTKEATQKFIEEKRAQNANEYFLPKYNFECSVVEEKLEALKIFVLNKQNNPQNVVFYFHGGAYFKPPLKFHLRFLKNLVKGTGAEVRLVVYPKAPNYCCQTAYNLFLKYYFNYCKNNSPKKITFMGDSSGGGLALGLLQVISKTEVITPTNLILFSPWLDASLSNPEVVKRDKRDPMHSSVGLKILGKVWAGDLDVKHPQVSPIYSSFTGDCNVHLYAGTNELLYPDILKYYNAVKDAQNCTLTVGNGLNHVWNVFPIPEAKKALKKICKIVAAVQ